MLAYLASIDRAHPDARPTAAVLPVSANMIGGDNDNYSAQMTEAVTSELARLGTIRVAPFASAMQFAGTHPAADAATNALGSRYLIEASVDDEASEVLIVARVVDGSTAERLWTSDYRGERENVRGMAARMAIDISAAILSHHPAP